MTTVHAYTGSQAIVDSPHRHLRRGRAAAANLIPASTGAAIATTKALPEYRGRFEGAAVRTSHDRIAGGHRVGRSPTDHGGRGEPGVHCGSRSERYRGVRRASDPVVSSDIIKDPRASVVDLNMTQAIDGDLIKVMSWYNNEWGYSNQLVREALRIAGGVEHDRR